MYETLLKPIWTYELQLWGNIKNSGILIKLKRFEILLSRN